MQRFAAYVILMPVTGEVSEWSKVTDSKSVVVKATVGSNPTLSAIENKGFRVYYVREPFFIGILYVKSVLK